VFHHANYETQIRVHRLQLVQFLEHPDPVAGVSPGRIGSAKVVVERQDIVSQLRRRFRVVALQFVTVPGKRRLPVCISPPRLSVPTSGLSFGSLRRKAFCSASSAR